MAYLTKFTTIGFRLESVPYTKEVTFSASDYSVPAENIAASIDIPTQELKYARGDYSLDGLSVGTRSGKITFDVPLYYSGTAATPPKYFELLRACGMAQTIHTTTGVSLATHSDYSNVPITIELQKTNEGTSPNSVVYIFSGCTGEAKIAAGKVGEYCKISFEFTGVLDSIVDRASGSYVTPSFTHYQPEVFLSCGVTLFGVAQQVSSFNFALNNTVELFPDQSKASGYQGAHVTNRGPVIEVDPDLLALASDNHYSRLTSATTGAFLAQLSSRITLSAAKVQIKEAYNLTEREGHYANKIVLQCLRTSGNDEFELIHGSKT